MATDASSTPVSSLCMVLVQTFSALGLGYLCIRAKFVDPAKGEMGAVRFYIAWIGLPLSVFQKLATASLGDIDWGVILACNLAKLVVFAVTFAMTLAAYKSERNLGQRVLTATTFAFFAVASNDLALGFPVIKAMYGPEKEIYIAANVFIFQSLFQPLTMLLFEMGVAWRRLEEHGGGEGSGGFLALLGSVGKGLVQNVVIAATLLGLAYQLLLGSKGLLASTVQVVDGEGLFPHPVQDVVQLWTAPFTFLFLFLNGTALVESSLGFWAAMLVLMKVVVCAYLSFFLGCAMISPDQTALRDFTFFYGSLPAGGAPLVFATLFDPSCVGVVASASLYCLLLAGPIELVTALFLGPSLMMDQVLQVQQAVAIASVVGSGAFLLVLVLAGREPAAPSWVNGCYAGAAFAYGLVTVLIHRFEATTCGAWAWERLFGALQLACCLLVLYMQHRLVFGRSSRWTHVLALAALAALVALALPYFNTWDDLCQGTPEGSVLALTLLLCSNLALLIASCGLTVRGLALKRRVRARSASVEGCVGLARLSDGDTQAQSRRSFCVGGCALALAVLQAMRLLMEVLNLMIKIFGKTRSSSMAFTPMLMLVNILEHGQGAILLVIAIFNGEVGTMLQALFRSFAFHLPPEVPDLSSSVLSEDLRAHPPELAHRGCVSLPPRGASFQDLADVGPSRDGPRSMW